MRIDRVSPTLGARVSDLDLSEPDSACCDALRAALPMHGVLFLHTPEGDPAALLGLARIFGEPIRNPHPKFGALPEFPEVSVVVNDAANPPDINVWHTDTTFMQVPAGVCVLQCQECPPEGGDTLWASMYAAHDALSPGLRAWLATLQAEHRLPLDTVSPALVRSLGEREIAALHPLVRWIPETGRRSLFVNRVYTKRIAGLHRTESSGLLSMLFDLAESPDFQVRLRWQPGDIAIWDNRITQHYATADYYPARRVMHRIALRGEAPLPVPAA
jgi:taurine dioxygenase